jgi:hypothetical protein
MIHFSLVFKLPYERPIHLVPCEVQARLHDCSIIYRTHIVSHRGTLHLAFLPHSPFSPLGLHLAHLRHCTVEGMVLP